MTSGQDDFREKESNQILSYRRSLKYFVLFFNMYCKHKDITSEMNVQGDRHYTQKQCDRSVQGQTLQVRWIYRGQTLHKIWFCLDMYYSVFHVIVLQEQGCCELVLGLIVSPKASMWPQDWAEFSFRSEILSNWLNNVTGRWSEKGKN